MKIDAVFLQAEVVVGAGKAKTIHSNTVESLEYNEDKRCIIVETKTGTIIIIPEFNIAGMYPCKDQPKELPKKKDGVK
jgi:hypothetical protein